MGEESKVQVDVKDLKEIGALKASVGNLDARLNRTDDRVEKMEDILYNGLRTVEHAQNETMIQVSSMKSDIKYIKESIEKRDKERSSGGGLPMKYVYIGFTCLGLFVGGIGYAIFTIIGG